MMTPHHKAHLHLRRGLDRRYLRTVAVLLYGQSQMHFPHRQGPGRCENHCTTTWRACLSRQSGYNGEVGHTGADSLTGHLQFLPYHYSGIEPVLSSWK